MTQTQVNGGTQIKSGTITTTQISGSAGITDGQLATSYIKADGTRAFSGEVAGIDPTSSTHLATKNYVDTVLQGLTAKYSAVASTNTETLTISSGSVTQVTGTTVDGQSPAVNDYILIMNAPAANGAAGGTTLSTQPGNGLYLVSSNTTNLSVSRATDMSGSIKPDGVYIFVSGGATWGGGGFIVTTPSGSGAFTYGTNNIAFTQFSGAGEISVDATITKSGNQLSRPAISGDVTIATGSNSATVTKINSTALSGLATGLLKNTTGTGVPTIAAASTDYVGPTSGSAIQKASSGGLAAATTSDIIAGLVTRETPTGLVNSSNTSYTLANTPVSGTEQVFLNGILQEPGAGNDYTISAAVLTYLTAPVTGDRLRVTYWK